MNTENLQQAWKDYKGGSTSARDALMEHYEPYVKGLARKMCFPHHVPFDELAQDARIGLWNSMEKFDPDRFGVQKFETFSFLRIRGEMMDGIRRRDWLPRYFRQKWKSTKEKFSLENPMLCGKSEDGWGEQPFDWKDELQDERPTPYQAAETMDAWTSLLRPLPKQQRRMVELYYRDGRSLREIGKEVGLSESRVCQLLHMAYKILQGKAA